jgi:serine/threonine protein kinase
MAPITPSAIDFISSCLEKDPTKRITTKDMQIHPWMMLSEDDLEDQYEMMCKQIEEAKSK